MELSDNAVRFIDLNKKIEKEVRRYEGLSFRDAVLEDCFNCILRTKGGYEPTHEDIKECYSILEVFYPSDKVRYLAAS